MLLLLPGILSFKMLAYPVHATDRFKKEIRIPLARIQCYLQFLLISMRKVRLYGYSTLLLLPGIQPLHVAFPVYSTAFFVDLNLIPFAYNQSYQRFVPLSLRKVRLRGFSMFVLLPGIQQSSPLTPPLLPTSPQPPQNSQRLWKIHNSIFAMEQITVMASSSSLNSFEKPLPKPISF